MYFFDTHIHLSSSEPCKYPTKLVDFCLNINTNIQEYKHNFGKDNVYQALSSIPQNCNESLEDHNQILSFIKKMLAKNHKSLDAIGETGLDAPFASKSAQALQIIAFKENLKVAEQYNKPIIIHCRHAFKELIAVLKDRPQRELPGIIHCFTGSCKDAKELIKMGWLISISGIITFKKSGALAEAIADVPLEFILLETDAPYLAPVPHRGKQNKSDYIFYTAQSLTKIFNKNLEELRIITSSNARRVLRIHQS